jgi:hypothetical protein
MSSKFVLSVFFFAALAIGAAIFLKQQFRTPSQPSLASATPVQAQVDQAPEVAPLPATPPLAPAPAPSVAKVMTPDDVQAEEDRLSTWQMNDDPQSLSNILGDLSSPEKDIRMAAIEAAKQFGSTNAIPVLKAAVKNTDDSDEQMALIEAANFLTLPQADMVASGSSTPSTPQQHQAIQQSQAEAAIDRQAQQQVQSLKRNSQSPPGNHIPSSPNQNQNPPQN